MIPKKILNREFDYIKKKIKNNKDWEKLLCKIAVYSYTVKGYKSMHQGKHVEDCIIKLLDGITLDNDGSETHTYYGNCDFYLHNLPISLKSSIKNKKIGRMFSIDGSYNQNFCKVFDTSRRLNNKNPRETLTNLLKRVGWEIPILVYTYDIKLNKGIFYFTSLSEITQNKFGIKKITDSVQFKSKITDMFNFNGSSHYSISLQDAYLAALKNKRVLSFEFTKQQCISYIRKKKLEKMPILDEIR